MGIGARLHSLKWKLRSETGSGSACAMPKLETAMADVHLQSAAGDDGGCESPNTGASENAGRAEVAREVVVSNNKRTAVDCASRPLSPPSGPPEAIRDVHSSCASTPATRAPLTAASLIRAPCPPGSPPAPSSKELSAFEGPDWTADLPDSEQVRRFRSFDWPARTSLGDLRSWSIAARIHVFTLFADSRPACLYWVCRSPLQSLARCLTRLQGPRKVYDLQ